MPSPKTWIVLLAVFSAAPSRYLSADWQQWGGPDRNFMVDARDLSESWDSDGPFSLFCHPLSGGHSAVVTSGDRVFVLHGQKKRERLTALRSDGRLLWEKEYPVTYEARVEAHDGPHATPLIWEDLVITVSIDATVRGRSIATGKEIWKRDLKADHGVTLPQAGFAASPMVVDRSIMLPGLGAAAPDNTRVEKAGLGVIALDARTGRTRWARHAFTSSHASPVLIEVAGRRLAVFHGMEKLVALDAESGDVLWQFRVRSGAADNVSFTPLWDPKSRTLFLSHAYDRLGMQAIQIPEEGGAPVRRWSNRKLKVEHGNAVLMNGMVIASHRGSPGFLVALDQESGEERWRKRLPKAMFLRVGDRLLILDEKGTLHMARPDRSGPGIVSSLKLLDDITWTAPTIVGRTLYVRSPSLLRALELSEN